MAPDEERAKDGLGEHVERAVEGHLRVYGNDVASLTQAPCNRVEAPEDERQTAAHLKYSSNVATDVLCMQSCLVGEHVYNVEERSAPCVMESAYGLPETRCVYPPNAKKPHL